MSEEEQEDIRKRVIRLVEQFDYALTVEQLLKMIKRQIPKVETYDIIEVIYDVANNGDLPPGKYIIVPRKSMREALKIKKNKRISSGPVLENAPIPSSVTVTSTDIDSANWDTFTMSDNNSATVPIDVMISELEQFTEEPKEEKEQEEEEMEVKTKMSEEQFQQLDAQYEILINGDKIYLHPRFKKEADKLPEKIMDLFEEYGEMTPAEVVEKLNDDESIAFDSEVRGMRIAFVVAWKQVENKLIDASTLLG